MQTVFFRIFFEATVMTPGKIQIIYSFLTNKIYRRNSFSVNEPEFHAIFEPPGIQTTPGALLINL
jgi:hypothetical protein